MAAPDSTKVEVEFTAGVWTDVSAYVDWSAGGSIRFGRTSSFGAPQVASLNLTLDNTDGRFSPGRQVLSDGTTAHPYYPNVRPRRRIRFSVVVSAVTYTLFTGLIKGWPQSFRNGIHPRVVISANDILDRLGRVELKAPIRQELGIAGPDYHWPLTDPEGSSLASEASGRTSLAVETVGSGYQLTFGSTGPGIGDGTSVSFNAATSSPHRWQYLTAPVVLSTAALSFEFWFKIDAPVAFGDYTLVALKDPESYGVDTSVGVAVRVSPSLDGVSNALYVKYNDLTRSFAASSSVADAVWHHFAMVMSGVLGVDDKLYLDGALFTSTAADVTMGTTSVMNVGGERDYSNIRSMIGSVGQVAVYARQITAAEILAHYQAGKAWSGETVDARVKRALGYAGLTSSDWTVDASTVTCSTYPQDGKSVAQMCHDCAETEGGGAAFYVHTDGKARFKNRGYRSPTAPTLTVDAAADLYGDPFASSFDEDTIVTDVTGNRATSSGTATSQVVSDAAALAEFGRASDSFTSYAASDDDVLRVAQDRLAQQHEPGYRLPKVTVDPVTGTTAGLWAAIAATGIGDRLRITNVPANAAPRGTIDGIVEGWTIDFGDETFYVTYDTSPADSPARGVWDSTTYGKWGCDGNTLNTTLADGTTTTVVIATAAGKQTFTTTGAAYPLTIRIGEEDITLTSAPSGATSPQTFTGVTRGANGTGKSAHTAGATITLAPAPTWSI